MANSMRWTAAVVAACAVYVTGCSGGSSPAAEVAPSCNHAPIPATGPGDLDHYFPVDVGRTWTYDVRDNAGVIGTQTVTVASPTTVDGEPVSVFANAWTIGTENGSGTDAYAVRPAGVYLVASTGATAPLDQTLPALVIRFPVQDATEQTEQVACQNLRYVDETGTHVTDLVERVWTSGVLPTDTFVKAGAFAGAVLVSRHIQLTDGDVEIWVGDYYAPGVGLILEQAGFYAGGVAVGATGLELTSYTAP